MMPILKLIILWLIYFVIHSVFATGYVKLRFKRHLPWMFAYYRIIYVFFATVGLAAVFMYQSSLPFVYLYKMTALITLLGLSLASVGVMVVIASFKYYDAGEFLGLRQLKGGGEDHTFISRGLLRYIRHPLYSGSILFLIGYFLISPHIPNLVSALCMILYFVVGARFEEKKLVNAFGEDYLRYKMTTPAFIPNIRTLIRKSFKPKNQ